MTWVDKKKMSKENVISWGKILYAVSLLNYRGNKEFVTHILSLVCTNPDIVNLETWGYIIYGSLLFDCANKQIFTFLIDKLKETKEITDKNIGHLPEHSYQLLKQDF